MLKFGYQSVAEIDLLSKKSLGSQKNCNRVAAYLRGPYLKEVVRHRSDLSDLHVFYAVAVCGGLNAAARSLRVDPSTVSRALDQLEARLNTRLVRRTAQGVVLTKAGEMALARVRTIESQIEEMEREVFDSEATSPIGAVTLSCSDGVGAYLLTPALTHLLRENPKLDVRLDCGLWPNNPMEADAEIALVFNAEPIPGYVSKPIAYFHYALFGTQAFFELYGIPENIEDALRHPFLHHTAQKLTANMPRKVPAFQDLARRRVETNSSAAVVEGVLSGIGLAAMPTVLASVYPELVMVGEAVEPLEMSLVYHRDIERIPRIKVVLKWLEAVFDQKTKPWYRREFVSPHEFAPFIGAQSTNLPLGAGKVTERAPAETQVPKRRNATSGA
ncbi:MAG: LysR family transcriptional regulator [Hyphomonadaceae bacterium]|jgi:DNA-binding transcriptional LysR family regulator